jgi:hypothetical protein
MTAIVNGEFGRLGLEPMGNSAEIQKNNTAGDFKVS